MTLAELRDHLLRYIGVLGAGDAAASAEDADLAETVLANCQDELDKLGVSLWTTADVPSYAVEGICTYAAPSIAPSFGKAAEYPLQLKSIGLRMLREVTQDQRTSIGTADYF